MTSPLNNLTDTWANAGTVFTGLKYNITNTASANNSLLFDFQIGGNSLCSFNPKTGNNDATLTMSNASNPTVGVIFTVNPFNTGQDLLIGCTGAGYIYFQRFGTVGNIDINIGASYAFGWSSGNPGAAALDTPLFRDAAQILALRKTTSPCTLRVYNTFTDASNYERGVFDWTTSSNTLIIGTQKLGTGSTRPIQIVVGGNDALDIAVTSGLVNTTAPNGYFSSQTGFAGVSFAPGFSNGLNSNVSTYAFTRVTGPTGGFSVGGFSIAGTTPPDGMMFYLFNTTTQQMTIVNEDASSTAALRITTLTGANIVLRSGTSFATLKYDAGSSRWIVTATN